MRQAKRLPVAVLGAGLIGVDLAAKIARSAALDCRLVVARDDNAPGLRQAARLGIPTSARGIQSLLEAPERYAVVFDATNASAHAEHAEQLRLLGSRVVDLTPSRAGRMVVPSVNGDDALTCDDVSMISCGGQASVPVVHAITRAHHIDYAEVVTTAASPSVGRSTRLNLDEYVGTTQQAVRDFTGVKDVKAILNISPARPPATFRVAMTLIGRKLTAGPVESAVESAVRRVRAFVSGYRVAACTVHENKAFVAVEVTASGDRIPQYAGNLDIINAAAVHVAERLAASGHSSIGRETHE